MNGETKENVADYKKIIQFFLVTILVVLVFPAGGCFFENEISKGYDCPIYVGPRGASFWAEPENPEMLFGGCTVKKCTIQRYQDDSPVYGKDSWANLYEQTVENGVESEMILVSQAKNPYRVVDKETDADKSKDGTELKMAAKFIGREVVGGLTVSVRKILSTGELIGEDSFGNFYGVIQGDETVENLEIIDAWKDRLVVNGKTVERWKSVRNKEPSRRDVFGHENKILFFEGIGENAKIIGIPEYGNIYQMRGEDDYIKVGEAMYRDFGQNKRKRLVTRGTGENEKWTYERDGKIFQFEGAEELVAGQYAYHWVSPKNESKLKTLVLMSKGMEKDSKWCGMRDGIFYIEE